MSDPPRTRTPGAIRARYAVLVSEFKLTLDEIYDLTPRQIAEIYFHPRDKHGAIIPPEGDAPPPVDPVARLEQLLALRDLFKFSDEQAAEIRRRLEALRGQTS